MKNTGKKNPHDFGLGKDFLNKTPKAISIKGKKKKKMTNFTKIFSSLKDLSKRMKKQHTDRRQKTTFAYHILDKGFNAKSIKSFKTW